MDYEVRTAPRGSGRAKLGVNAAERVRGRQKILAALTATLQLTSTTLAIGAWVICEHNW
jgi:hypothetical protein